MPPAAHESIADSPQHSQSIHEVLRSKDQVAEAVPWRALFFFTTTAHIPVLVVGITCSLIAGAATPAQSFLIGKLFDGLSAYALGSSDVAHMMAYEKKYVLYLVVVAGFDWLFHSLEFMSWLAFGELQAKSARDRLFHGLLEQDVGWYDMRTNGIAALLPRLQAQVRDLQFATAQPLGILLELTSTAVLSIVEAFYYSWDLTLVILATTPLILVFVVWLGNDMQHHLANQTAKLSEAQKFSTSALSAIDTVKCFNAQAMEQQKYMKRISDAADSFGRVMYASGLQMAAVVLLSISMFVQGFYYGGILVGSGKKTSGDVITTFFSAIGGFQALQAILPQMVFLEKGRSAGSTLRAIMAQVKTGSPVESRKNLLRPLVCRGDIHVKNLSFAYPTRPGQVAIDDVTMSIPQGETTFLIGKSGSGKSTLSQLLLRFYHPTSGEFFVDGIPVESLDITWLRSNITLVEQQSLLFNDTVFQNIAFGKADHSTVTKTQVSNVAEFALLQLMINDMPHGLDTVVGYKGGALSGGQRQRMALARARLRDTPILLLDESTSALDHISRTLMMDAIRQWRRGKTTIIITHDVSQILPDDYLYLLEGGKLVQEGCRKHLEKQKDTPFQLFLPPELRAVSSPQESRKGTAYESIRTRGTSLDSAEQMSLPEFMIADPLETQLEARKNNGISLLPTIFNDSSSHAIMQGFGKTANIASPWMRMAVTPQPASPVEAKRSSQMVLNDGKIGREGIRENPRRSLVLQSLIDRTGKIAAATRSRKQGIYKRHGARNDLKCGDLNDESDHQTANASQNRQQQLNDGPWSPLSFKHIVASIWPNVNWSTRATLLLGFWGASVHAVATPVFAYILSKLLETYARPGGDKHLALIYSMAMLGVAAVDAAHTYLYRYLLGCVGRCWVDNIRGKALERMLDQPKSFFDDPEHSVSRIADALDRSAEEMVNILANFSALIWMALLMCTVSIIWAAVVSWKMTLISMAAAPYVLGNTRVFAAVSGKWEIRSNTASDGASAIFTEVFTNIKTVRSLTLESHFLAKYILATNHTLLVGIQRSFYSGFFYGLSDSAAGFSEAMLFFIAAKLVASGTPVPDVIQVAATLLFAVTKLGVILEGIPQLGNSKDSASRLLRLADLPADSHEHKGDTRVVTIGEIVFENLRFAYPSRPEQTILNDINLRISPGTSTAIVGGSGSGKSTIANLLLDIYSTTEVLSKGQRADGDLTIAGRGMTHISTPSLRSLIVSVSQTPTLFAATVAENIGYGLEPFSPYNNTVSITAAAQQAGIHEFISSLPRGYSTIIGEGGLGLSGGQAQRIAIARALVRKPEVLILDEATSALDVESASLVRQTITSLVNDKCRNMTVLIITHDRDMMEIAENVVVLDQGSIVEEGSFNELLAKGGALSNLLSGGEWAGNDKLHGGSSRRRGGARLKEVDWLVRKQALRKTRL